MVEVGTASYRLAYLKNQVVAGVSMRYLAIGGNLKMSSVIKQNGILIDSTWSLWYVYVGHGVVMILTVKYQDLDDFLFHF